MNLLRVFHLATVLALAAASAAATANTPLSGQAAHAEARYARVLNPLLTTRTVVLASKPAATPSRGSKPLQAATGVAPGQAGYVHYFLLRMPDGSTEVQVGIELDDQRIAWSFPGLGVVISPFIDGGELQAGGQTHEVWHLYAIRPFPDDAAMARLRRALPARIDPWVKAGVPYCFDDSPQDKCMSCLGFVLRTLFPGRGSDYPGLPQDFRYTGIASRYTPDDLLLYLSGMPELPSRAARLQRLATLDLPADLRMDLEELVYAMKPGEAVPLTARQQKTGAAPARSNSPQPPRGKL